jgi:tetratricopeptide (TPR) repeat protein
MEASPNLAHISYDGVPRFTMTARHRFVASILALSLGFSARPASAQDVAPGGAAAPAAPAPKPAPRKIDKATIDAAKSAYGAGETAYKAGDYKGAIQSFQDAQAIIPSAQAAYWLAMSFKADAQVPAAIAEFERLLADPGSSRIGEEKLNESRTIIEELKKTPGKLEVASDPPGATVAVDGAAPVPTPAALDLAPGAHKLILALNGYLDAEVELEMPPGSKGAQTFKLEAAPPLPLVAPVAATVVAPVAPGQTMVLAPSQPNPKVPAYVLLGLSGVGVITGTIFGILAVSNESNFNDNPSNDAADRAERYSLAADISFGAAITLGLAGATALLVTPSSGGEKPEKTPEAARLRTPGKAISFAPYSSTSSGGARLRLSF